MKALVIGDLQGNLEFLGKLTEVIPQIRPHMILFTGGITKGTARLREFEKALQEKRHPDRFRPEILEEEKEDLMLYERFFDSLGNLDLPVYTVPGRMDAPLHRYEKAARDHEITFPKIRSVHQGFAFFHEYEIVGLGGEITEHDREDFFILRYPRWEAEYSLKFVFDLKPRQLLMLFHTPPRSGEFDLVGGRYIGSEVVTDLIKTFNPRYAFVGTLPTPRKGWVGDTLVVAPGALAQGYYAVVDLTDRSVEFGDLRG